MGDDGYDDFNRRQTLISQWCDELKEENMLGTFFSDQFLDGYQEKIESSLRNCHILKVGLMPDKASLLCLYSVPLESLEYTLCAFLRTPFMRGRDKTVYHNFEYRLSEADCVLTWSILDTVTGETAVSDTRQAVQDIPTIKEFISKYVIMYEKTRESIATFLKETALIDYYEKSHLEKREEEIFEWLRVSFISFGVLVHIDCTQPYMLRQLFTAKHTATKVLDLFTRHKFFTGDRIFPTHIKKECRMTCSELPLNARTLKFQLGSNHDVFTDADEYRDMMKANAHNPTGLVDVGQVLHEERVKCITVIEKPEYSTIYNIFAANQMLGNELKELDDDNKLKVCVQRKNKELASLGKTMIATTLTGMSRDIHYDGSLVIDPDVPPCLTKRTVNMSDSIGGILPSWRTVQDFVNLVVAETNHILQRDGNMFSGNMRVSKDTLSLSSFDDTQSHLWSPSIKKLMNDPQDKLSIEQHFEKNINVGTLGVTIGRDELTRRVIPCSVNNAYYVNNGIIDNSVGDNHNNIIVNLNITSPTTHTREGDGGGGRIRRQRGDLDEIVPNTNKRKRMNEVVIEKIKRVRGVHETREGDDTEDSLPIYRIINTRVENPNHHTVLQCIVCDALKVYSSFYDKRSKEGTHDEWGYQRNICHACVTMKKKLDAVEKQKK